MNFEGGCHCGDFRYQLTWPEGAGRLPARRCTCDYCTRFNAVWTSHPQARLAVSVPGGAQPGRYRFATATADFLFCPRCGVSFAAVCEIDGALKGVLNVNTLDGAEVLEFDRSDSDFEGESREQRLARRGDRWIGEVVLDQRA